MPNAGGDLVIGGRSVIALIPARGGSKSIPGKNVALLGGKPLLSWSIAAARRVPEIDGIFVSTDSEKIARIAKRYGAEVIHRPAAFSADTSPTVDMVRHALGVLKGSGLDPAYCVLLEPTCPLRRPSDIKRCLSYFLETRKHYDSVATFQEARLHPWRSWIIENGTPRSFIRGSLFWSPRQNLPVAYQLNGAVYAFRTATITKKSRHLLNGVCGSVIMPNNSTVDIDHVHDLRQAEILMKQRQRSTR